MTKNEQNQFIICVPIASDARWPGRAVEEVERRLAALGNPVQPAVKAKLDATAPADPARIHFMSMSVIWDGNSDEDAFLVVDISGDGSKREVIAALIRRAGNLLLPVFESALGIQSLIELERCLNRHTLQPTTHPLAWLWGGYALGLPFQGTPGLSVRRIKDDDKIERIARNAVDGLRAERRDAEPCDYLERARKSLRDAKIDFDVRDSETQSGDPVRPKRSIVHAIFRLSLDSWLALIVELITFAAIAGLMFLIFDPDDQVVFKQLTGQLTEHAREIVVLSAMLALAIFLPRVKIASSPLVARFLGIAALLMTVGLLASSPFVRSVVFIGVATAIVAWILLILVVLMSASLLAALVGWLSWKLRQSETSDRPADKDPDPALVQAIMTHENPLYAANGERMVQNHLTAVSAVKPGWLRRRVMLRIGLHVVELAVESGVFPRGFLSNIGTIHFAQWVRIPGKKLLFLSNYDGSWESYLEDFITKASEGLTIVWSNATDFPKTNWLYQDGARDGDRFKRWVRRQQIPTLFWYSAYPSLTARQIRDNAKIRYGLARAESGSDAEDWLSYFTSSPQPTRAIETQEIQRLAFDGMRNLVDGACLLVRFPKDAKAGAANAWLKEIVDKVAFGDTPHQGNAMFVALSWRGLEKLGLAGSLTKPCVEGDGGTNPARLAAEFSPAFVLGMDHPTRNNPLGDLNDCAPTEWCWGGAKNFGFVDAVLLIYTPAGTSTQPIVRALDDEIARIKGYGLCNEPIRFRRLPDKGKAMTEPFGFVDGISQPIIKGVDRTARNVDQNNQVEAGEFILGYPDGRDRYPPTPQVHAKFDIGSHLPSLPPDFESNGEVPPNDLRDLGRNGSFLVIRQLEQDVSGFDSLLDRAASQLNELHPKKSHEERKQWVAAKMLGRWRNGASLVRFPHEEPTSDAQEEFAKSVAALKAGTGTKSSDVRNSAKGAGDPATERQIAVKGDNDFLFGRDDPRGLRCPLGAHIRRANPRDSFAPDDMVQIAITNRHRLLRRGRVYDDGTTSGLLFMCLNADIERQFEFVQQAWMSSNSFDGLRDETDPFASMPRDKGCFTIPTASGPIRVTDMKSYVKVRGGSYFFLPSKKALQFLSKLQGSAKRVT